MTLYSESARYALTFSAPLVPVAVGSTDSTTGGAVAISFMATSGGTPELGKLDEPAGRVALWNWTGSRGPTGDTQAAATATAQIRANRWTMTGTLQLPGDAGL